MKKIISFLSIFILSFFTPSLLLAQTHNSMTSSHTDNNHVMVNSSEFKWLNGPASLPPGSRVAVIEGDPSKAGPFTMRLEFPANYRVGPHFHPAIEHVTVLSGSFFMGTGKEFNEASAKEIKEGGFAVMPVGAPTFCFYSW